MGIAGSIDVIAAEIIFADTAHHVQSLVGMFTRLDRWQLLKQVAKPFGGSVPGEDTPLLIPRACRKHLPAP